VADYVIDTNVLCCASARDERSLFDDADHIPADAQEAVFTWLATFRKDRERRLVIDEDFKIYDEYRNKLTDQDYGLLVVHEKLSSAHFVPVSYDGGDYGIVPAEIAALDASDRKFAAAAIAAATFGDDGRSVIANATDTDWFEVEAALMEHHVRVEQILASWCLAKLEAKKKRP
jgi:hypothetical protein